MAQSIHRDSDPTIDFRLCGTPVPNRFRTMKYSVFNVLDTLVPFRGSLQEPILPLRNTQRYLEDAPPIHHGSKYCAFRASNPV